MGKTGLFKAKCVLTTVMCLGLLTLLLAGCPSMVNLFSTDPWFDTVTDENGNRLFADTEEKWSTSVTIYGMDIERELDGVRPPGGRGTWNEKWLGTIKHLRTSQENPQRYIDYIVETRRKVGLPELVYEEETDQGQQ